MATGAGLIALEPTAVNERMLVALVSRASEAI